MELRFDHEDWLNRSFPSGAQADRLRLDWHALSTRLAAAHAFQRGCGDAPLMLAGGSFDPHVAQFLTGYAPVWDNPVLPATRVSTLLTLFLEGFEKPCLALIPVLPVPVIPAIEE